MSISNNNSHLFGYFFSLFPVISAWFWIGLFLCLFSFVGVYLFYPLAGAWPNTLIGTMHVWSPLFATCDHPSNERVITPVRDQVTLFREMNPPNDYQSSSSQESHIGVDWWLMMMIPILIRFYPHQRRWLDVSHSYRLGTFSWLFSAGLHDCMLLLAGLHDHYNRGRLSIEAFSSQSRVIKKLSKWKKKKKDWLEKSLNRKPAATEVIM